MLSTRNLMMATIILAHASPHAATISADASGGLSFIQLSTSSVLTPRSGAVDTITVSKFGLRERITHETRFTSFNGTLHGTYPYGDNIGFYGTLSAKSFIEDDQVFAGGSLKIQPSTVIPGITLGGYYETQSGSVIEAGGALTRLAFDLSHTSTGVLFNGYETKTAKSLYAYAAALELKICLPLSDNIKAYVGTQYGISLGSIDLKGYALANEIASTANSQGVGNQIASLVDPGDTNIDPIAYDMGDMYSTQPKTTASTISMGARYTFHEFE